MTNNSQVVKSISSYPTDTQVRIRGTVTGHTRSQTVLSIPGVGGSGTWHVDRRIMAQLVQPVPPSERLWMSLRKVPVGLDVDIFGVIDVAHVSSVGVRFAIETGFSIRWDITNTAEAYEGPSLSIKRRRSQPAA